MLNFKKTPKWAVVVCSFLTVLFIAGFATEPPQSLAADSTVGDHVSIECIGAWTFNSGDAIRGDFNWDGTGEVMLYINGRPYTDAEIQSMAEGQFIGNTRAGFSSGEKGPLLHLPLDTQGDDDYFYLSIHGDVRNLTGCLQRVYADSSVEDIFLLPNNQTAADTP